MKTPPATPEFRKFTSAMREIMAVSKDDLQRRIEAEKKGKRTSSASPSSVSASTSAR